MPAQNFQTNVYHHRKNQAMVEQYPHQMHLLSYQTQSFLLFPQYFYLQVLLLERNYSVRFLLPLSQVHVLNHLLAQFLEASQVV